HKVVGGNLVIEYVDGKRATVTGTLSDDKSTIFADNVYVDKESINFIILKEELTDKGLPIVNFKSVTYNRVKYSVESFTDSSTLGNSIKLLCKKVG
ncbi:MAG: hypothetical protein ACRC6B_00015, partial [Fusobacteriaceae bacterium]